MSARDYRDDCIEQLADELAATMRRAESAEFDLCTCQEQLVRAEADRDTWRLVAVQGIHHAHDLYLITQRESVTRLRDENGQLRAALTMERKAA